jgi:DNA polymerase-3 subunit epsilon
MPYIDAVRDSAEVVLPAHWPAPAATPEETEKILRWLESPGVRIVDLDGEWTCPVGGAGGARAELEPQAVARHAVAGFVAAS